MLTGRLSAIGRAGSPVDLAASPIVEGRRRVIVRVASVIVRAASADRLGGQAGRRSRACGSVVGRQRRLAAVPLGHRTMPAWSVSRLGQPDRPAAGLRGRRRRSHATAGCSTLVSPGCRARGGTGLASAAFGCGLGDVCHRAVPDRAHHGRRRRNPAARQTTAEGRQPPAVLGVAAPARRPSGRLVDQPASTNSPSPPVASSPGRARASSRAKSNDASRCVTAAVGAPRSPSRGPPTATPSASRLGGQRLEDVPLVHADAVP